MNKLFQMLDRTFLVVGNDMYEVFRIFEEHRVVNPEDVKKWCGAERVFRKDGNLFFCSLVEEATIIEEI